jgi:hypothetical protein
VTAVRASVFVGTSLDGFITRPNGAFDFSLFGPTGRDIALEHVATRPIASGLVQSEYVVVS